MSGMQASIVLLAGLCAVLAFGQVMLVIGLAFAGLNRRAAKAPTPPTQEAETK